jgi:cytidyltransferase-like protein
MTLDRSTAVCPGSYDPVTNGHLDVIRRAAALYEHVVVAVVNRSVRKDGTLFGIEERLGFIEGATADLPGVRVEPFNTLVVEFARRVGAKAIGVPHVEPAVQFPVIQRRQGARDVRGTDRGSGARGCRSTVAGRAQALTNWTGDAMSASYTDRGPRAPRR